MRPVHFEQLPPAVQVQLAAGSALLFGLVCGFVLSEGETGWIVLNLIAGLGGFAAGLDHAGPKEGALRGLVGGFLFGLGVVIADAITDETPAAEVPDPILLLVLLTTIFGVGLGALGGLVGRKIRAREDSAPSS